MSSEKKRLHERMSVSLDLETVELVEKLQTEYQTSKSEIVRKALQYLNIIAGEGKVSPEELRSIIRLTARPDTVTIDISLIEALLEGIDQESEKFKDEIRKVGQEIYHEYRDMGISTPTECLKTIEKTNLFKVAANSNDSFTLISANQKMDNILKVFLEGILENFQKGIEVKVEHGKIRVKQKEKE